MASSASFLVCRGTSGGHVSTRCADQKAHDVTSFAYSRWRWWAQSLLCPAPSHSVACKPPCGARGRSIRWTCVTLVMKAGDKLESLLWFLLINPIRYPGRGFVPVHIIVDPAQHILCRLRRRGPRCLFAYFVLHLCRLVRKGVTCAALHATSLTPRPIRIIRHFGRMLLIGRHSWRGGA